MVSRLIKKYVKARQDLLREVAEIQERLSEIDEVLVATEQGVRPSRAAASAPKSRKRPRNKISLREAVRKVTTDKALNKVEIIAAVKQLGYRFRSGDPITQLNTILNSDGQFKKSRGKYRRV